MTVDHIEAACIAARRIGHIRDLQREPAETALPELQKLLSPAQGDAVLRETVMAVRSFGTQAAGLLPAVEKLKDHPDPGVRDLVRSATKRIREGGQATGDTP